MGREASRRMLGCASAVADLPWDESSSAPASSSGGLEEWRLCQCLSPSFNSVLRVLRRKRVIRVRYGVESRWRGDVIGSRSESSSSIS